MRVAGGTGDQLELRKRYEGDFYLFCRDVIGLPHLWEPLHRPLCECLQGMELDPKPYTCLLIPRGHFKTTIGSIAYPLWRYCKDPDLMILVAQGKIEHAAKILRQIKTQCVKNQMLRWLWPDVFWENPERESPVWTSTEIVLKRSNWREKVPSMTIGSLDSSVVSLHFNLLIHDDLVFKENVLTAESRQRVKEYRKESEGLWQSADTKVLNIGTRWHWDDAHQELVEGGDFDGKGARGDYAGEVRGMLLTCWADAEKTIPVFPSVVAKDPFTGKETRKGHTCEGLRRIKKRMGNHIFSCQFENNPRDDSEKYFRRETMLWFRLGEDGVLPTPQQVRYFTAVDPNRSEKVRNDPAAVVTAAIDEDGHFWVVDIQKGHPTGPQLVQWIHAAVLRWNPIKVYVETQNYQLQLCRWLKEDMLKSGVVYRIQEVERTSATTKDMMITAMENMVAAGGLHIREGLDDLALEMEQYPDGAHDDMVDALSFIYAFGRKSKPEKKEVAVPYNPFTGDAVLRSMGIAAQWDDEGGDGQKHPRSAFQSERPRYGRVRTLAPLD